MSDTPAYSVAGRDTGGRVYTLGELALIHPSWAWSETEGGDLAKAECSLGLARDDVAQALSDFEATGTRPGWVKTSERLLREVEKLRAAVETELDA